MSEAKRYSILDIHVLYPEFKEMLSRLSNEMVNHKLNIVVPYHFTGKVDGQTFNFYVNSNGLSSLGVDISPEAIAITATTHFGGRIYTVGCTMGDLEKKNVTDTELSNLTDDFIRAVVNGIARNYYNESLLEKVRQFSKDKDFEAIRELSGGLISSSYDEYGFRVALYASPVEHPEPLIENCLYDQINPVSPAMILERYNRYLEEAFILGLGARFIMPDQWTAPINS